MSSHVEALLDTRFTAQPLPGVVVLRDAGQLEAISAAELWLDLRAAKALLFRGAPVTLEQFLRFSERFISSFRADPSSPGNRPTLPEDDATYEAVTGEQSVAPHAELSSLPAPPELLFLYCAAPAETGGETTLYDGVEVAQRLDPQVRRRFEASPVVYLHRWAPAQWVHYFRTSERGQVERALAALPSVRRMRWEGEVLSFEHQARAITPEGGFVNGVVNILERKKQGINDVRWSDGSAIEPDVIAAVRDATTAAEVPVRWTRGAILAVDNHRVMHGRRAFRGERRIAVRFGAAR